MSIFFSQLTSCTFTEDSPCLTKLDSLGKEGVLVICCCINYHKSKCLKTALNMNYLHYFYRLVI